MNRRLAIVLGAALAGLAIGLLLRPQGLPSTTYGDRALAERVRELAPSRASALAVGVVRDGTTRIASIGAPLDGEYEIGSITKAITGMLYADAVERDEVTPGERLGSLLELGDARAGSITLEQLAQHRSGLPSVPGGIDAVPRALWSMAAARNPYTQDRDDLLRQLRDIVPAERAEPEYSNLGFQALGHALAAAAQRPYPQLVAERIARPLGLRSLSVPLRDADLTPRAVEGTDGAGRHQQPWLGESLAPAGGIRAGVGDMTTLIEAILDGTAPGMGALDPVADFEEGRQIGAAWITEREDGRTITWHNGATGGFSSWLGVDREAGAGVVILAATSAPVDDAGRDLLLETVRAGR